MIDYGDVFDKKDSKTAKINLNFNPYTASISDLRKTFFNKIIDSQHAKGTVFLDGGTISNVIDLAPFLFFHNSISLQVCPLCPQVKDIENLKLYLEKGLITIFLVTNLSAYSKDFQKFAKQ